MHRVRNAVARGEKTQLQLVPGAADPFRKLPGSAEPPPVLRCCETPGMVFGSTWEFGFPVGRFFSTKRRRQKVRPTASKEDADFGSSQTLALFCPNHTALCLWFQQFLTRMQIRVRASPNLRENGSKKHTPLPPNPPHTAARPRRSSRWRLCCRRPARLRRGKIGKICLHRGNFIRGLQRVPETFPTPFERTVRSFS